MVFALQHYNAFATSLTSRAVYALGAIVCTLGAMALLVWRPTLGRAMMWLVYIALVLVSLHATTRYSTGASTSTELLQAAMCVAIMIVALVGILLRYLVMHGWISLRRMVLILLVASLVMTLALLHTREVWSRGLTTDVRLETSWPRCELPARVSMRHLLPLGALSFVLSGTNSQCPSNTRHSFEAFIETRRAAPVPRRVLHIVNCTGVAEYQFTPAFFSPEPSSSTCSQQQQQQQQLDDEHDDVVLDSQPSLESEVANLPPEYAEMLAEFRPFASTMPRRATTPCRSRYTAPIELPEEVEWVRTFCNNEERFLVAIGPRAAERKRPIRKRPPLERPPNLLVLMLDSVSRLEFLRSLPRTSAWLAQHKQPPNATDLERATNATSFEFFRYMALGGSTKPTLTPMLTGQAYRTYQTHMTFTQLSLLSKQPVLDGDDERNVDPLGMFWQWFRRGPHRYITTFITAQCQDYFAAFWGFASHDSDNRATVLGLDHELVLPFCHPHYTAKGTLSLIPARSLLETIS